MLRFFFTFAFVKGKFYRVKLYIFYIYPNFIPRVSNFLFISRENNKILKRPQIAVIIIRSHNFRYT